MPTLEERAKAAWQAYMQTVVPYSERDAIWEKLPQVTRQGWQDAVEAALRYGIPENVVPVFDDRDDRFIHVSALGERIALETLQDKVLVADAWAFLRPPYGPEEGETLPIVLVAKPSYPGFKVYWGTNHQTYEHILTWGIRVKNEALARQHFPMLRDVPFVRG